MKSFKINTDHLSWIIIFILSLFLLNNLFQKGIYYSHDGIIHLARLAQAKTALLEGQFPLRWLGNWNFGFGYPNFVFIYSLPYYLGILISFIITDWEVVFKILIFLSLFLSGLSCFYFLKLYFPKIAAFVGSIFYLSAPYRFADIYERGALGECLSFILTPLLFYNAHIFVKHKIKGYLISTAIIFLYITTHSLTLLIMLPVSIIYAFLLFRKDVKTFSLYILSIISGFVLAAFQWVPMIFDQQYIDLNNTYYNIYKEHYLTIFQLLRIPKEGINIGTGIQLGIAQITVTLITLLLIAYWYLRKNKTDEFLLFFLLTTLISAFLTTGYSKFFWENIKGLQKILFPWRFLVLTTFTASFLASYVLKTLKKYSLLMVPFLLILAVFPSRHYLKGNNWQDYPNSYYENYQDPDQTETYYLPKNVTNLSNLKLEPLSIITGKGKVLLTKKQNNLILARVNLEEESLLQFHTIYYPGWKIFVDNTENEIITHYPGLENHIVAQIKSGKHSIVLKFTETPIRKTADLISLFSLGIYLLFTISVKAIKLKKL